MNANTRLKKALSMMLVLVLVFTLLPVGASAAVSGRTSDTIFFATDRHEESSKLQSLLRALEYEPGLVVLGGDHVNNTNSGSLASITSEIQSVYPGVQTFYTYAAHDPNVQADSSNPYAFARTGEVYEGEDYYVYGVDQNDMQSSSSAATASSNFKSWAASADPGKVIFVMCHMPIHKRRNDNAGGATWMTALNEAGQTHDIVFLWGHNHTGESSADTSVYFVARGGSLTPQGGSTGTINFTYMNAGYIKNGYASMVVINDETVNVTRYNTSGSVTATYTIDRLFAGHTHSWQVSETVDATCGQDGSVTYVCAGCGDSYTEVTAATGSHTYESVAVDATCGENGAVTYTCTVCGDGYTETIPATGEHDYVTETVDATCTEDGSATYTCAACGDSYAEVIAATGHSYNAVMTEPTCTEAGYTTYTCTACGDSYVADETAALGHNYEAVTVDATCTEDGSVTYTCACGDTYTEVIAAAGHSYEAVTTEATCSGNGYTTHTCTACGDSYVDGETAALGHDYETVTVEATCTENGYTAYTCVRCGEGSVYDETEALGHAYASVTTEATCTAGGYTTHTCERCGDSYVDGETAALGHQLTSVVTEADCENDGYTTYTCTICGEVTVDSYIAALGHAYETVTVEATCTENGSDTHTCATCGDSYVEEIAALGHSYETVAVDATCTENGSVTTTCATCGETTVEVIEAEGHAYEAVVTEATCTEAGCTTYTCAACGDSYVTDEIAALGHAYEAVVTEATCTEAGCTTNTCAACGDSYVAEQTAALGHSYTTEEVDGYLVYTCEHCGDTYSESVEVVYSYGKVTAFTSGENYVITVYSNRKYYALSHEGNTLSAVQVTVSNSEITSEITEDMVWTYSDSKLSYMDGDTTYYLYAGSSSGWGGWFGWGSAALSVSTTNSSTVSFSSSKLKVGSYYLRYSGGTIKADRSATTTYLFRETEEK